MDEMIPTYWLYAINSEVVIVLYYIDKELNTIPDAKLCFAMSQVYNRQSLLKVSIELSELEFIMLTSVLFISDVFASGCRWILRINPTKKKKKEVKIAPRQLAIAFLVSIWKSPVKCVLQRITEISSMDSIV